MPPDKNRRANTTIAVAIAIAVCFVAVAGARFVRTLGGPEIAFAPLASLTRDQPPKRSTPAENPAAASSAEEQIPDPGDAGAPVDPSASASTAAGQTDDPTDQPESITTLVTSTGLILPAPIPRRIIVTPPPTVKPPPATTVPTTEPPTTEPPSTDPPPTDPPPTDPPPTDPPPTDPPPTDPPPTDPPPTEELVLTIDVGGLVHLLLP